jgi:hypothetical protein
MRALPLHRLPAAPLLIVTALLSQPAAAGHDRWSTETGGFAPAYAPRSVAERRVSLQQAVERVQRATGGRVLDAKDQGDHYRIKVLTRSGEVRIVIVDATTGDMR